MSNDLWKILREEKIPDELSFDEVEGLSELYFDYLARVLVVIDQYFNKADSKLILPNQQERLNLAHLILYYGKNVMEEFCENPFTGVTPAERSSSPSESCTGPVVDRDSLRTTTAGLCCKAPSGVFDLETITERIICDDGTTYFQIKLPLCIKNWSIMCSIWMSNKLRKLKKDSLKRRRVETRRSKFKLTINLPSEKSHDYVSDDQYTPKCSECGECDHYRSNLYDVYFYEKSDGKEWKFCRECCKKNEIPCYKLISITGFGSRTEHCTQCGKIIGIDCIESDIFKINSPVECSSFRWKWILGIDGCNFQLEWNAHDFNQAKDWIIDSTKIPGIVSKIILDFSMLEGMSFYKKFGLTCHVFGDHNNSLIVNNNNSCFIVVEALDGNETISMYRYSNIDITSIKDVFDDTKIVYYDH